MSNIAPDKIPHLLFECGRHDYQSKVSLNFQDTTGTKKWRQPLGAEYIPAIDRVRELTKEHDALLLFLRDPEKRSDRKSETRRIHEAEQSVKDTAADAAYRRWWSDNDRDHPEFFGEDAMSLSLDAEARERRWESAALFVASLDSAQTEPRCNPAILQALIEQLGTSDANPRSVTLPPYPEYHPLVEAASLRVQEAVRFLPHIPSAMDDDEYHGSLVDVLNSHFGPDVTPSHDREDRDEFDLTKQRLERKIARVARSPDTITKVAERY